MYDYSYAYGDPNTIAGLAAMLLPTLCFAIVGLLMFIAWCRLLAKAGLPWERMFVPFLGTYSQYSVANCGGLFWASVILVSVTAMMYLVSTVLGAILESARASAFSFSTSFIARSWLQPMAAAAALQRGWSSSTPSSS